MFKKIWETIKAPFTILKLLITGHYHVNQEGIHNSGYWPRLRKFVTSITIHDSVTSIGDHELKNYSNLRSVTIGNKVASIGKHAFDYCSKLKSVTIGNSVASIGWGAFYDCRSLSSVTIGNKVTSIGNFAFDSCTNLSSITIPDSVTSLGTHAFYNCPNLNSVTIGNKVTSIGNNAFEGCSKLSSITIPDSVTSIGKSAFTGCSKLNSIHIAAKSENEYARIKSILPKELRGKVKAFEGSNAAKQDERGVTERMSSQAKVNSLALSGQRNALFNSSKPAAATVASEVAQSQQVGPK